MRQNGVIRAAKSQIFAGENASAGALLAVECFGKFKVFGV
jgi:hypothetical protein